MHLGKFGKLLAFDTPGAALAPGAGAPVNDVAPVLSPAIEAQSPFATNGTWSGSQPITYSQKYLLAGVEIAPSYVFTSADVGKTLVCTVTATNSFSSVTANSNTVTVQAGDSTPNAFSFTPQTNVTPGALVTSNAATVSGLGPFMSAPVTLSGPASAEWRKNSGAWTKTAGTVVEGDQVQVRHLASSTDNANVTSTLTIGGVAGAFQSTTGDVTPSAFSFAPANNVETNTPTISGSVTPAGYTLPTSISITGGEYRINGGAWTSAPGTLQPGQSVQVRVTSAATGGVQTSATLTVGGVSAAFTVTTIVYSAPSPFTFGVQSNAQRGVVVTSSVATIAGINVASDVSVSGAPGSEWRKNSGTWGSAPGTVSNGDTVQVRHTSSGSDSTLTRTTLTVGGVSANFDVTTGIATPSAFSFPPVVDVELSTPVISASITPAGITIASPVSITGGEYRINGGSWTANAGSISPGQSIEVRVTSAPTGVSTRTATLTIGGVSANFAVTTVAVAAGPARYIRRNAAGAADGTSWANAADLGAINSMIAAVGPGGTVYIRADEGNYSRTSRITLSAGGSPGNDVVVAGVNATLQPMKATIRGGRTHPWPVGAVGTSGNDLFLIAAGCNHLQFRSLNLEAFRYVVVIGDAHTGLSFGNPAFKDTAVAALLPPDYVFPDRHTPEYKNLIEQIYTVSGVGVSPDIQLHAVDVSNCNRFIDCGDPSTGSTSDTVNDFGVYGGVYRGCARGWFRFRGAGRGIWLQDIDMDGGGLEYVSDSDNFNVGCELNGPGSQTPGDGVSNVVTLRCIANRHRSTVRGGYTNGDGFSGERSNQNCVYIRCTANDNEDGGIETKASNVTIIGVQAIGNRRNLRLWGFADAHHVDLRYPTKLDGRGYDACQVFTDNSYGWIRIWSGSMVDNVVDGFTFYGAANTRDFIACSNDVVITKDPAQKMFTSQAATFRQMLLFDPTDLGVPAFTSAAPTEVEENTPLDYDPTANRPVYFTNVGGPDTALVGRLQRFTFPAQSYAAPADADRNNVYDWTIEAETPQGVKARQNVSIRVKAPPAPTNFNIFSGTEAFEGAYWAKNNLSVVANAAANPLNGLVTADRIVVDAANTTKGLDSGSFDTPAGGQKYTMSFYAKADGVRFVQLRVGGAFGNGYSNYDLVNGVLGTLTNGTSPMSNQLITPAGNGWYRISATIQPIALKTSVFVISLIPAANSVRAVTWLGDGTSGILLWGAQLELGDVLTPYAPQP